MVIFLTYSIRPDLEYQSPQKNFRLPSWLKLFQFHCKFQKQMRKHDIRLVRIYISEGILVKIVKLALSLLVSHQQ